MDFLLELGPSERTHGVNSLNCAEVWRPVTASTLISIIMTEGRELARLEGHKGRSHWEHGRPIMRAGTRPCRAETPETVWN